MKRAVNVPSMDNACFAWSVVATLHSARSNSSYLHYTTVLNLTDIMFPMTLNQIRKLENLNNISINVYLIEKQKEILPLRLIDRKRGKHQSLVRIDPCNDNIGHFAWIKDLSRFSKL